MSRFRIVCPVAVRALMRLFAAHGEAAYPVGGCVRDVLMGVPPHDWDVAVTTPPDRTTALCEAAGWRVIPTGMQHGTVTVLVPEDDGTCRPLECTTCRTEGGYSDGRHPDGVTFTGLIEDDLSRRDFTVNAMAFVTSADPDKGEGEAFGLLDLFGGRDDLRAGVIRCVGNPHVRLTEDALRILRAVRFAVKLGFDIYPATREAMMNHAAGLACISRERVRDEFEKILLSPHPTRGVSLLAEMGLLPYVLPRGISPSGMGDLAALPADFAVRVACLMRGMSPADARENLRSLKMSNEQFETASILQSGILPTEQTPYTARLLRRDYQALARPLILIEQVCGADIVSLLMMVEASEAAADPTRVADLALNGRDLCAMGVPPGPAIGETLAALLDCVLKDPAKNTREVLSEMVQWMGK